LPPFYTRREQWEVDREKLLDAELSNAPVPDARLGYVVAYARPVVPDDGMVERAAADGPGIGKLLMTGARSWGDVRADRDGRGYSPDLREAIHVSRRGAGNPGDLQGTSPDQIGVGFIGTPPPPPACVPGLFSIAGEKHGNFVVKDDMP
jgi:hypothetical protein